MLGSVGRLHQHKRLDAAIRLLVGDLSWHLALAGQGADKGRLRLLASDLKVLDRLHFIGEIAPDQIGKFLACLDVFVFPSQAETFGLAAVEAANAGIPCVVSNLPVLQEVLSYEGKPAALFVDASDPLTLLTAVRRILADTPLREELRRTGKWLKTRYSADAMVDEYVRMLDNVGASLPSQFEMRPI